MKNLLFKLNIKSASGKSAGFTLVEALVAISILLISVVGPLSIVSESIKIANLGKDQVTAFYLAQEAIEYLRNKRDTNVLQNLSWLSGPEIGNCDGVDTCRIDVTSDSTANCLNDPGGVCKKLNKFRDASSEMVTFLYNSGVEYEATSFSRSVNIKEVVSNREAVITVKMEWTSNLIQREFTIVERIFNWSGI